MKGHEVEDLIARKELASRYKMKGQIYIEGESKYEIKA